MKSIKKFTAMFLSLLICIICVPFSSAYAQSALTTGTYEDLTYQISDNEVTITSCNKTATEVEIPSEIDGLPVTSIGDKAFKDCTILKSVDIPDSVTYIGAEAYSYCSSLTSVIIPDSVTRIKSYSFAYCSGLTEISLENSITNIEGFAFYNCDSLTALSIPDSVVSIKENSFGFCDNLTYVTIGKSLVSFNDFSFYWCTKLTSIKVDDNNTYFSDIDGVLFNKDCTELIQYPTGRIDESYSIPNTVQKHPAGQVIAGYDSKTAPSIAVPKSKHNKIPNIKGDYSGNARGLLANDIKNSRNYTDAPNSSLRELISLNKSMYPDAF